MAKKPKFPVKGTIPDKDHDRLLEEKAKDFTGKRLLVGDRVVFCRKKRFNKGEIIDIYLEYSINHQWVPNYNIIYCIIKVKGDGCMGYSGWPSEFIRI